jgi:hypothetical protein
MAFFSPNKSISFSDNLINSNMTPSAVSTPTYAANTPGSLNSPKTFDQVSSSSLKHPKKLSKNISSGSFFSRTRKNHGNRGNSHRATTGETLVHQDSLDSSAIFCKENKSVKCSTSKSADHNLVQTAALSSSSFKQTKSKKRIFSISHMNNLKSGSRQVNECTNSKIFFLF